MIIAVKHIASEFIAEFVHWRDLPGYAVLSHWIDESEYL